MGTSENEGWENGTAVHWYNSTAAVGDECRKRNVELRHDKWTGGMTAAEQVQSCFCGNTKNVAKAEKLIGELNAALPIEQMRWEAGIVGAFPSVPDFLAGNPECMRHKMADANDRAPIRIFASITASAAFSAAEMEKRGTAILALCIALSLVRPVELYATAELGGSNNNNNHLYAVNIHAAPLELATAGFALAAAVFSRSVLFQLCYTEKNPWSGQWAWDRQPQTSEYKRRVRMAFGMTDDDLWIPPIYSGTEGDALAHTDPVKWVREKLEFFGIPIAEGA